MTKITELASLNKTTAILVDEFAGRERHRGRSDLRKMFKQLEEKHKNVNKDDFMDAFRKLQDMGLGSIVIGRGTNPTRFIWNYNLKEIGLAAKGKIKEDQIHSLKANGGTYQSKSIPNSPQKAPQDKQVVAFTGVGVEVLIIAPRTGDIQRFKVPGDREELIRKLLGEFGEQL